MHKHDQDVNGRPGGYLIPLPCSSPTRQDEARAAIAALFTAIAEPSEGMVEAGMCKGCRENERDDFPEIYKAMLARCHIEVLGE